jgi:hypothetical protein
VIASPMPYPEHEPEPRQPSANEIKDRIDLRADQLYRAAVNGTPAGDDVIAHLAESVLDRWLDSLRAADGGMEAYDLADALALAAEECAREEIAG